ncbi:unnamed protein product, partial [Brachionus calyciflorus]
MLANLILKIILFYELALVSDSQYVIEIESIEKISPTQVILNLTNPTNCIGCELNFYCSGPCVYSSIIYPTLVNTSTCSFLPYMPGLEFQFTFYMIQSGQYYFSAYSKKLIEPEPVVSIYLDNSTVDTLSFSWETPVLTFFHITTFHALIRKHLKLNIQTHIQMTLMKPI